MAITDIQISEELETNAPSIKYSGNEGPKSPQEMEMMADAMLQEEYEKYIYDLLEIRPEATPMSFEEFKQMTLAEGQMSGGQPLPQDPTKPINPFAPKPTGPTLPNRQMAAFGGIMGVDGRRRYGLGSKLKKFVRKVIPNEVAEIAVKAAPFVAPFNPIAAGLMSGIGSFDQTGRIGSSLKSGLMNYGLGQVARGIGGGMDNLQGMSLKTMPGKTGFGSYFSSPIQDTGGLGKFLANRSKEAVSASSLSGEELIATGTEYYKNPALQAKYGSVTDYQKFIASQKAPNLNLLDKAVSTFTNLSPIAKGALGAGAVTALLNMSPEQTVSEIMDRGEGLDVEGIRAEVIEAYKDQSGEKLKALRSKYPFLGKRESKDIANMAMGGRIGFAEGSSGEDFYLDEEGNYSDTAFKDKAKEIGGSYTGLLDFGAGVNMVEDLFTKKYEQGLSMEEAIKALEQQWEDSIESGAYTINQSNIGQLGITSKDQIREKVMEGWDMVKGPETQTGVMTAAYGGRIGRAEGGLMNLGGMEKDYRAEGGFVPIGKAEKADDVPARLSVNEFVFTADAVRNAGGGDIDKGAEVMENMMKHLEQGGQVSEESQGMQGARDMFATSERLSEVVA